MLIHFLLKHNKNRPSFRRRRFQMSNYSFVPVSNLQIFCKDRLFLKQFHRRVADDTGCTDMDLKQPNESGYLLVMKIVSETKIN